MADEKNKVIRDNLLNPGLRLQLVLDTAKAYGSGEMTQEEIGDWGKQWVVRSSLPMRDKMVILTRLVNEYRYSDSEMQENAVCELYKNIFFYLYLEGYLGVPIIAEGDVTFDNYDLLEPLFGPWVESYAGRDINIFKDMLNRTFELYNLNGMNSILGSISEEAIENSIESNRRFFEDLEKNKDLIGDLKDIMMFNDPNTAQMMESLNKIGLEGEVK